MGQQLTTAAYWVQVGIVVVGAVLAFVSALRRGRDKAARFDLALGLAGLIAIYAMAVWVKGTASGFVVMAIATAIGVAVGFLGAKARLPLALFAALCIAFALIMVVFGEPGAQSWGFYAIVLAFGTATGQGVKHLAADKAPSNGEACRDVKVPVAEDAPAAQSV